MSTSVVIWKKAKGGWYFDCDFCYKSLGPYGFQEMAMRVANNHLTRKHKGQNLGIVCEWPLEKS